jgi:hypothetical protein
MPPPVHFRERDMAKNKKRQRAIVRRLRGPKRPRTQIGLRVPLLFVALVIVAMMLDMCAFPPSRRNVVLAEACNSTQSEWAADERPWNPSPVEKEEACQ